MKKTYIQPTTVVAEIQQQHIICGTQVNALGGGIFDGTISPGDGTGGSSPRSRGLDDLWEEEF